MLHLKHFAVAVIAAVLSASAFAGTGDPSVSTAAASAAVAPSSPVFATIDNPADPTFNQLLGINDSGEIVGYNGSGAQGHPNQAYTIKSPYTTFAPVAVPGSVQMQATGINNSGDVSGFWSNTNTGTDANFGVVREGVSKFVYFDVTDPLVNSSPSVDQVLGINESRLAVGFYLDANSAPHGFLYSMSAGQFAPVNIAGAVSDAATGIANDDMICGYFTNSAGKTLGFVKPKSGVSVTSFDVPGATVTQFLGVNDLGIAVGFYLGADTFPHGVAYNLATGKVTYLDDPSGDMGTTLNGINNKGEIVGFYTDAASNTHGMLIVGATF